MSSNYHQMLDDDIMCGEGGEFCPSARDVVPLSEAAEKHYRCGHPLCNLCSNRPSCSELYGHLYSN